MSGKFNNYQRRVTKGNRRSMLNQSRPNNSNFWRIIKQLKSELGETESNYREEVESERGLLSKRRTKLSHSYDHPSNPYNYDLWRTRRSPKSELKENSNSNCRGSWVREGADYPNAEQKASQFKHHRSNNPYSFSLWRTTNSTQVRIDVYINAKEWTNLGVGRISKHGSQSEVAGSPILGRSEDTKTYSWTINQLKSPHEHIANLHTPRFQNHRPAIGTIALHLSEGVAEKQHPRNEISW